MGSSPVSNSNAHNPRQTSTEGLQVVPEGTEVFATLEMGGDTSNVTTRSDQGGIGLGVSHSIGDNTEVYGAASTDFSIYSTDFSRSQTGLVNDLELAGGIRHVEMPDGKGKFGYYAEAGAATNLAKEKQLPSPTNPDPDGTTPVVGHVAAGGIAQVSNHLTATAGIEGQMSNVSIKDSMAHGENINIAATGSVQYTSENGLTVSVYGKQGLLDQPLHPSPNPKPGPVPPTPSDLTGRSSQMGVKVTYDANENLQLNLGQETTIGPNGSRFGALTVGGTYKF